MTHGSLFSGIGGFDLVAEWMGWDNVFHCELNPFGQRVLKYYWPNSITYGDITKTDFTIHRGTIDVLTGGFPCQPYSQAGERRGKEDERHLWPEMLRAIREIQPRWVVGENVRGLTNWNGGMVFDEVQSDLETIGYEVTPFILPACSTNAPHRRGRVWFVAYNNSFGSKCRTSDRDIKKETETIRSNIQFETDRSCCEQSTPNSPDPGTKRLQFSGENSVYKSGAAPHSASTRREWTGQGTENETGQQESEQTGELAGRFEGLRIQGNASDTLRNRSQRSIYAGENSAQGWENENRHAEECLHFDRRNVQFDNFPTQSPVCSRNDGLSSQLDGITFPKWRKESIKAYGNAIVPQVVYQIFKAIRMYTLC